jgi:restriction system protein
MKPLLEALSNNPHKAIKLQDAVEVLADRFKLSEEERNQLLPSGKVALFNNRVSWAKVYLVKAGLLESPRRAYFQITQRGLDAITVSDIDINNAYLKQFDEFAAFKHSSNEKSESENSLSSEDNTFLEDNDITPDEALRNAYKTIHDALAEDILERTRNVSPAFFEQLLIDLLIAMGYGGSEEGTAHALGKSGDNGVDGVINQDPLGVDQIYIQAKRYAQGNNVSSGNIRDFFGAINLKNAQKGLFITTSDFTASAKETAHKLSSRIVLVNGDELAKLMLRYNIGCRNEQTLHIKKIDEDFFEN